MKAGMADSALASSVSDSARRVAWAAISGMPGGFADGIDDTGAPQEHDHDTIYYTQDELSTSGTINDTSNPVNWTKLKMVPAGFVDGVDDTLGAHDHNASYYTKGELKTAGTLNDTSNPVDWTKLKNVPLGFADSVDDTGSGGGGGDGDGHSLDADDDDPADVVYVDAEGEVGIGTTTPEDLLHINYGDSSTVRIGNSPHMLLREDAASGDFLVHLAGGGYNSKVLQLGRDNMGHDLSLMGSTGIGTKTPAVELDVRGSLHVGVPDTGHDVNFYGDNTGARLFWDAEKYALRAGEEYNNGWAPDSMGEHSLAVGNRTVAGGSGSVALGSHSKARGHSAVALGGGRAQGDGAHAVGACDAVGDNSIAIGHASYATGSSSAAIGWRVQATAQNAIAVGSGLDYPTTIPLVNDNSSSLIVGFDGLPTLYVGSGGAGINITEPSAALEVQPRGSPGIGENIFEVAVDGDPSATFQYIECMKRPSLWDIEFKVNNLGHVYADGSFTGPADFSEMIEVTDGAHTVEPGDVMVISSGPDRSTTKSSSARSTLVAGIYSTQPGFIGSSRDWDKRLPDSEEIGTYSLEDMASEFDEIPLAVVGIVPCKVSAENGPIEHGDLLVTSNTPGHAMRDDDPKTGTVIGKALGSLRSGTGVIEVLVTLQ
jgi:hypothetical protein